MFKKILIIVVFLFFPLFTQAEGITLSIAPPLIKNNVNPGQIWKSSVKVVNNNAEDVEIYTEVLDFKSGEIGGTVDFLPILNEQEKADKLRLSSWIVMADKKIVIPAFKSVDLSFIIDVPKTAEPGGHYAAILVGTKPPEAKVAGSVVKTASILSSLILLSVSGDIKENGRIREFSTDKDFYFNPKVDFKVKFENLGNVHIQPQGEIRIYDFFGKNKEIITLNHKSEFGNVLPGNNRLWNFSWQGSGNLLEMGRYKAQLILSYGTKERETIDQVLFFWIIYPKPLLIIVGVLLTLFLLLFFSIRAYIKRSIRSAQLANGIVDNKKTSITKNNVNFISKPVVNQTDKEKIINLKTSSTVFEEKKEIMKKTKGGFKKTIIFILLSLLVFTGIFVYWYFFAKSGQTIDYNKLYQENKAIKSAEKTEASSVATTSIDNNQELDLVIDNEAGGSEIETVASNTEETVGSSSNILAEDEEDVTHLFASSSDDLIPDEIIPKINGELLVKVLNGSGMTGVAGEVVNLVGQKKYEVAQVGNADNYDYETTIIKYKKGDLNFAEEIKILVDRKAILEESINQEENIVLIIGKSFVSNNQ